MIAWRDSQKFALFSLAHRHFSARESATLIDGQRGGLLASRFARENKRRFQIEEGFLDQPPTQQGEQGSYDRRS
jgi:hypothetical protein